MMLVSSPSMVRQQIIKSNIDFYKVDCTNFEQMDDVFSEQKNIDAVIHFAAFKS